MSLLGNIFKVILAFAMVAAVLVAGIFIFTKANGLFGSTEKTHEKVVFVVKPGESTTTIGENLKAAGVLEKSGLIDPIDQFKLELKSKQVENKIQAGRFDLETNMDIGKLVAKLAGPSTTVGLTFQVIEGKRLEEIAEELELKNVVSATHFITLTTRPENSSQFPSDLLAASQRPGDQGLEGYLFPDKYEIEFREGDNSEAVIKKMLSTMEAKFTPEMRQAAADRGRTIHEILTVASIVQREGVVAEELPTIAAVFWNRVANDMRLDADPTTQYALGQSPNWWKPIEVDDLNAVEHTHNTYYISGLPPGPICNPGEAAIRAAVYPTEGSNFLYFVAKGDGSGQHAFAETLEEHNRNVTEYRKTQP